MKIEELTIIKAGYEGVHERIIPFMLKMEEDKLRERIIPKINPVAWMVWHVLRVEDMFLSNVVFRKEQEFHKNNWLNRLNIHTPNVGTGMTTVQADQLALEIDINAIRDYNRAVKEHTFKLLKLFPDWPGDQLDDAEEIERRLIESKAFPLSVAKNRAIAYAPTPVSTCILGVISHTYMHFGQYLALTKPL